MRLELPESDMHRLAVDKKCECLKKTRICLDLLSHNNVPSEENC
jgi:hypothetical protein